MHSIRLTNKSQQVRGIAFKKIVDNHAEIYVAIRDGRAEDASVKMLALVDETLGIISQAAMQEAEARNGGIPTAA